MIQLFAIPLSGVRPTSFYTQFKSFQTQMRGKAGFVAILKKAKKVCGQVICKRHADVFVGEDARCVNSWTGLGRM